MGLAVGLFECATQLRGKTLEISDCKDRILKLYPITTGGKKLLSAGWQVPIKTVIQKLKMGQYYLGIIYLNYRFL